MRLAVFFAALFDPASASTVGPRVDRLFWTQVALGGAVLAGLFSVIAFFLVRYRRGSSAPRPPLRLHEWQLEAGWIGATTLIFIGLFVWGARVYLDLERVPAGAMTIEVVGRQWMWDVRHADGRREFNTLHVPVNQAVRLRLSSEDVIHSIFVPAFRIKQDLVPGKVVDTWFEATRPGRYHLFCAQYCGTQHAAMTGEVIAQTPEAYAAWLTAGRPGGSSPGMGRRLFVRYGCSGCHEPNATMRAPRLEGLYGRLVPLADGGFARFDDAYVRDSILEPGKQVAAGYAAVMPSFKGLIPEGDLLELTAYLRSLKMEQTVDHEEGRP